jgi:hypothetical protein
MLLTCSQIPQSLDISVITPFTPFQTFCRSFPIRQLDIHRRLLSQIDIRCHGVRPFDFSFSKTTSRLSMLCCRLGAASEIFRSWFNYYCDYTKLSYVVNSSGTNLAGFLDHHHHVTSHHYWHILLKQNVVHIDSQLMTSGSSFHVHIPYPSCLCRSSLLLCPRKRQVKCGFAHAASKCSIPPPMPRRKRYKTIVWGNRSRKKSLYNF